jgi:hypothetical protein
MLICIAFEIRSGSPQMVKSEERIFSMHFWLLHNSSFILVPDDQEIGYGDHDAAEDHG